VLGVSRLSFLLVLLTLPRGILDTLGTLADLGAADGLLGQKGDFPDIAREGPAPTRLSARAGRALR
jgi:hypothetical protein